MALNDLAAAQSTAKQSTKDALTQLLDYLSTHSNTKIRNYESPMMFQIHSDKSYILALKWRDRSAAFFFLSNNPAQSDQAKLNGAIRVLDKIIKRVVGSVSESEIASAFCKCS